MSTEHIIGDELLYRQISQGNFRTTSLHYVAVFWLLLKSNVQLESIADRWYACIWTNFNSYTDPTPSDMLMILLLDQYEHAAYVIMGRPLGSITFAIVLISVPKKSEKELD